MALTEKRRRFVEAYMGEACGNATRAATIAGYKSPRREGSRLLSFADIQDEIRARQEDDPLVMNRMERQRTLTEIARTHAEPSGQRMRAIELLGKMGGDYIDRVEHSGGVVIDVRWADEGDAP